MQRIILATCGFVALAGCAEPNQYQSPPPPSVTVAKPLTQSVTNYLEETGTTEAVERVEIRARVRGFLDDVQFKDGQEVNVGDELYLIQPREYLAKVSAAKADVQTKEVALNLAEIQLKRQQNLLKDNATAQTNVDQAKAERDGAIAELEASKAALDQAQLDLDYTKVTTPISGRVERTLVKRGNLVGDNQATHLTTVMGYDPIYVYFNISERALLRATSREPGESSERRDITKIKAYLRRAIDDGFPFVGHLDYADLGVDQSTGTFTIRAVFPNPDLDIFPGLFVRIRVPLGTTESAVLVPERAIGADQAGRYVAIVVGDNTVERRNVELGAKYGDMVLVEKGLSGNESVVIDGIQRARPGGTVDAQETQLDQISDSLESVEEGGQPPVKPEQDEAAGSTEGDSAAGDPASQSDAQPSSNEGSKPSDPQG